MTLADDIRAWTRANERARLAYRLREAELAARCPECSALRDGRHRLCWRCRKGNGRAAK